MVEGGVDGRTASSLDFFFLFFPPMTAPPRDSDPRLFGCLSFRCGQIHRCRTAPGPPSQVAVAPAAATGALASVLHPSSVAKAEANAMLADPGGGYTDGNYLLSNHSMPDQYILNLVFKGK